MNRRIFAMGLMLVLLVTLIGATGVLAAHGDPAGSCPRGFHLDHFMDHSEHMHRHIGIAKDTNGDGFICMRHLPKDLHLHVDNYLPLD